MRIASFGFAAALLAAVVVPGCTGDRVEGRSGSPEAASASGAADQDVSEEEMGSGLIYTQVVAGSGPSPGPTDTVVVHYHGTFPDGSVFDSSVKRGQPARFPLNRVIPCWTEALQKMRVGGKAKLVCPPEIAYGARGGGPIPPNATLHFDVELLDIVK